MSRTLWWNRRFEIPNRFAWGFVSGLGSSLIGAAYSLLMLLGELPLKHAIFEIGLGLGGPVLIAGIVTLALFARRLRKAALGGLSAFVLVTILWGTLLFMNFRLF